MGMILVMVSLNMVIQALKVLEQLESWIFGRHKVCCRIATDAIFARPNCN
ncbi:hypothetical protein HanPI659440_Chr12g0460871 [Helianthus annuus]|nr:hypothetical protein HanPI659440_Chr12g0460871 [Helianthus annuus]